MKSLAPGHTVRKWYNWDLNPSCLAPKSPMAIKVN